MIVIGSKALLHRLEQTEEIKNRHKKSDYDVIMSPAEFSIWYRQYKDNILSIYPRQENKYKATVYLDGRKKQYEIEISYAGSSQEHLLKRSAFVCDGSITGFLGEWMETLSLPYQMLTKRSHLIYPVHFEKNIEDYHLLKKLTGNFTKDDLMDDYYKLRSDEAKVRFSKFKTPKLMVSNEDFFSSKLAVEHYFIHDDMHKVMAHNDVPVYEMMKHDFDSAWCERDMFFGLSYDLQIQCVQEEAYVIALERYIVPHAGDDWKDHFECYKKALKRICTTLCSGWFRTFAIENYPVIIDRFNPRFVDILRDAFNAGEIEPIEGKTKLEVWMML